MRSNALLRSTSTSARALFCVLSVVACALAPHVNTHAQTPVRASKGSAFVAGRVTCEEHPVAGVLVALMPVNWSGFGPPQPAAKATTDAEGRYRLTNVPVGSYQLTANAPAYIISNANPLTARQGRLLNITADDQLEGLDFMLTRGGVITGRVTNAEGKPVVEARLRIITADEADRRNPQYMIPPFAFQTDDRGVYRIYGLLAGRYLVSVGEGQDEGFIRVGRASSYIPRTFYGDTSEQAQAKPVEVVAGAETSGVDITVGKPAHTYEAAGRVVDEHGQPVAGAGLIYGAVNATGRFTGGYGSDGTRTNERGEFRMKNLMPGHYGLFASQGQAFSQEPSATYSDAVAFEIIDQDVSGLEIKLTHGASISGTLVVEGTNNPAVVARLTELRLGAGTRATEGLVPPVSTEAHINADGSFLITGLRPGKVQLFLGYPPVKGFTLLRVQHDGADSPQGIEVTSGAQVSGVRVVVAYGTGVIRGQVQYPSGARPAGARIAVNVRRAGAAEGEGYVASVLVDELGRFVVENLSAGEYELTLFDAATPTPGQRRQPADRKLVNVPDTGEVQVTLVFNQTPPTQ
ncbi:MAG: hypothetical protein DMF64_06720 [Acidobacteria bacterium]|nr:MAG: hypothetical protein DMF64_06720 [Acidobacteriota bacterium]